MFIMSQDERLLVNTDNICSIFCTNDDEQYAVKNAILVMYPFNEGCDMIAKYNTIDEAKTVLSLIKEDLQEIHYTTEKRFRKEEGDIETPVFEMPDADEPIEEEEVEDIDLGEINNVGEAVSNSDKSEDNDTTNGEG